MCVFTLNRETETQIQREDSVAVFQVKVMSTALVPSKFYGSSLPRPRLYSDPKLNDERVDPPSPVLEPFITWAEEAHWSKGGLSTKRSRRHGKIEGNLTDLRSEPDDLSPSTVVKTQSSALTPPAPLAIKKRKRILCLADDGVAVTKLENCGEDCVRSEIGHFSVRKLWDDFNSAADENENKKGAPLKNITSRRTSPRLIKRRLN